MLGIIGFEHVKYRTLVLSKEILYTTMNLRFRIALLFALVLAACGRSVFTVYPLAEDYFEKVYVVNHNEKEYFLNINCRQQNILSISLTP